MYPICRLSGVREQKSRESKLLFRLGYLVPGPESNRHTFRLGILSLTAYLLGTPILAHFWRNDCNPATLLQTWFAPTIVDLIKGLSLGRQSARSDR